MTLVDRCEAGEISLIAPDFLLVEFASVVAKRVRRKELADEIAVQSFALLRTSSPVHLHETTPLLRHALTLSMENQMSLWDCVYLALAIERDCSLLTANQRLFRTGIGRHQHIRLLEQPHLLS